MGGGGDSCHYWPWNAMYGGVALSGTGRPAAGAAARQGRPASVLGRELLVADERECGLDERARRGRVVAVAVPRERDHAGRHTVTELDHVGVGVRPLDRETGHDRAAHA